jgi:hypothetical protein
MIRALMRILDFAPLRMRHVEQVRRVQNTDAVVSPQPKEIFVASDDDIRSSRYGAFEDSVVLRVFFNHVEPHGGRHRSRHRPHAPSPIRDLVVSPVELTPQHFFHFIEYRLGDREIYLAGARQFQNLKGFASPEVEVGDEDVCICSNPQHLAPVLGVFAADIADQPLHVFLADAFSPRTNLVALDVLDPALFFEIFAHGFGDDVLRLAVLGARGFLHLVQEFV